ncbi:MAG: sigma-E processing peptidase SpoIIGA [Bacillota bacterium]|nr:sigma-E processing peptidase SpoIIGA [Bacillota bacterium]
MITVYIDMLFAVNLLMDYLLLTLTGWLCGRAKWYRTLLGALLGTGYSTAAFFVSMGVICSFAVKVFVAVLMLIITFGVEGKRKLIKRTGIFFIVSFVAGGIVFAAFLSGNALISNGTVYFSATLRRLIFAGAVTYGAVRVVCACLGKFAVTRVSEVTLKIYLEEKIVEMRALSDTGNCLCEPLSGLPVCIIERRRFEQLCGESKKEKYLIPYRTVDNTDGMMEGIRPDKVVIIDCGGREFTCDCFVASTDTHIKEGTEGIINPCMITGGEENEKSYRIEKIHNKANTPHYIRR